MANYTIELRRYIESFSQYESGLSIREKIEKGRTHLFNFDYEIFDEKYRNVFETHFIRQFYTREIGFETMELFKFKLETWLQIHMPYYNKLFESELIKFDPLENAKMKVTHNLKKDKTKNDTKDSNSKATSDDTSKVVANSKHNGTKTDDETSFNRHLESTNPDNRLEISSEEGNGVIEYASKIDETRDSDRKNSSTNTNTDNTSDVTNHAEMTGESHDKLDSTINELQDYVEDRVGKIGNDSYAKMLNEYRNSFLRIEKQIFNEMQELFMMIL